MSRKLVSAAFAAAAVLTASAVHAASFDQNVTNNVIFGSGNANGGFTVEQTSSVGIELGLRGKLRFDAANQPQNQFNSNGDGTYTFPGGPAPGGFSFDPNSPTTPVWNFEWSINSNYNGNGGNLNSVFYTMRIDGDPTAATNFGVTFDPINTAFADHAIGDNTTGNGDGTVAGDATAYGNLIANNSLAQNSWNYEFFNDALPQLALFNPSIAGIYTIELTASGVVGEQFFVTNVGIDIVTSAIPVPAALPLFLSRLLGLGIMARRGRKVAA